MTKLMDIRSPKYMRRLVRELNTLLVSGQSIYACIGQPNHLKVVSASYCGNQIIVNGFKQVEPDRFFNGSDGSEISVSRE